MRNNEGSARNGYQVDFRVVKKGTTTNRQSKQTWLVDPIQRLVHDRLITDLMVHTSYDKQS